MTNIPDYLRIHREIDPTSPPQSMVESIDSIEQFWSDYAAATGWKVHSKQPGSESIDLLPVVTDETLECEPATAPTVVGKSAAFALARSASDLVEELAASRRELQRQQAELAVRAAILKTDADRDRMTERLEKTLADAAAACACDAAAFYMLDDETQYLKTRFVFGLAPDRLQQPPRTLRGSRGDLEAMVQGVVVIDDLTNDLADTWNCPEPFAAGICAAVQCDDVPIGTLWLFRQEAGPFSQRDTAATRLAVTNLASELAHAWDRDDTRPSADPAAIEDVSQWQYESLPIGAALADDWRVDGMIESPRRWATGWHTWDILPDGSLMLAIAEAVDPSAKGAMSAAIARAALAAHTGYRHTPAQLMQRISDTLWQTSTGEQLVSLLYARIDPETGQGEVASAGSIAGLVGSRFGYRPLVEGRSDPLNTHIDARFVSETFRLAEEETLLAYTHGLVEDGASQQMLGDRLRAAMEQTDTNPLAVIRRSIADLSLMRERGAVTLLRQSPRSSQETEPSEEAPSAD